LDNPDLVIIVEIFKSACALSIVKDFYKLHKFNIQACINERLPKKVQSPQHDQNTQMKRDN